VYLYDLENQAIVHTFLVGRKPEGLAIGPKTGKLYVASSYGINVFDIPSLIKVLNEDRRQPIH
jgi:DNA-binding beta-propeller fold protein YncE